MILSRLPPCAIGSKPAPPAEPPLLQYFYRRVPRELPAMQPHMQLRGQAVPALVGLRAQPLAAARLHAAPQQAQRGQACASRVAPAHRASQRATRCQAGAAAAGDNTFDPQVCVVLGTQWGDEGKGKLVDILAQTYDIVARAQVRVGGVLHAAAAAAAAAYVQRRLQSLGSGARPPAASLWLSSWPGIERGPKSRPPGAAAGPVLSRLPPSHPPLPGRRQRGSHDLRQRGQQVQAPPHPLRHPQPPGHLRGRQRRGGAPAGDV